MGRKKKKEYKPWCWYCNREFEDEKVLVFHQKSRHFRCQICRKRMFNGPSLAMHCIQFHRETLVTIPNSVPGRTDVDIDIFGMEGVPEDDIVEHKRQLEDFNKQRNRKRKDVGAVYGSLQHNFNMNDDSQSGQHSLDAEEDVSTSGLTKSKTECVPAPPCSKNDELVSSYVRSKSIELEDDYIHENNLQEMHILGVGKLSSKNIGIQQFYPDPPLSQSVYLPPPQEVPNFEFIPAPPKDDFTSNQIIPPPPPPLPFLVETKVLIRLPKEIPIPDFPPPLPAEDVPPPPPDPEELEQQLADHPAGELCMLDLTGFKQCNMRPTEKSVILHPDYDVSLEEYRLSVKPYPWYANNINVMAAFENQGVKPPTKEYSYLNVLVKNNFRTAY